MTGSTELKKLTWLIDWIPEIALSVAIFLCLVLVWELRIHFPLLLRFHHPQAALKFQGSFYIVGATSLLLALVGIFRPLLPQRAMLRNSDARFAAIARESDDVIFSVDVSGTVLSWNRGAEKTFGYAPNEILGQSVLRLAPAEHHHDVQRVYEKLRKGIPLVNYEAWKVTKHGERILLAFTVSPVTEERKGKPYFSVVGRNITDLHRRQEEVQIMASSLSESNQELEQFAYLASHDLQEPLRMITGYLTLVHQRYQHQLDKDAEEFIGFAMGGAKRMKRLIDGLLNYSRVGRSSLSLGTVEIASVVNDITFQLKDTIHRANAEISLGELPTVSGDELQLSQLFQNLITNALKFRRESKPHIQIGCEKRDRDWLFFVADNGIGLDIMQQDRIFTMFQRLHSQEEYPGSGIGLAVCKKIVERHGGGIWVTSTEGQGSTFWFTLPRVGSVA